MSSALYNNQNNHNNTLFKFVYLHCKNNMWTLLLMTEFGCVSYTHYWQAHKIKHSHNLATNPAFKRKGMLIVSLLMYY